MGIQVISFSSGTKKYWMENQLIHAEKQETVQLAMQHVRGKTGYESKLTLMNGK